MITVTRCRSTQGRTTYLILPSNPASHDSRQIFRDRQIAARELLQSAQPVLTLFATPIQIIVGFGFAPRVLFA